MVIVWHCWWAAEPSEEGDYKNAKNDDAEKGDFHIERRVAATARPTSLCLRRELCNPQFLVVMRGGNAQAVGVQREAARAVRQREDVNGILAR